MDTQWYFYQRVKEYTMDFPTMDKRLEKIQKKKARLMALIEFLLREWEKELEKQREEDQAYFEKKK